MVDAQARDRRTENVIATLRMKQERLREEASNVGPPCSKCHYGPSDNYSWNNYCGHPVFADITYNLVTGKVLTDKQMRPEAARQAGSACGPDAFLFERKTLWDWTRPIVTGPWMFALIPIAVLAIPFIVFASTHR